MLGIGAFVLAVGMGVLAGIAGATVPSPAILARRAGRAIPAYDTSVFIFAAPDFASKVARRDEIPTQ